MDILHLKIMVFIVICLDVLNNIFKEPVAWLSFQPPLVAAVLTLAIFAIFAIALILSSALILCYTTVTCGVFCVWVWQLFAVLAYFFGDNLPNVLHMYSEPLKCGRFCQTISRYAAVALLIVSLLLQYSIPYPQQDEGDSKVPLSKDRRPWWIHTLNIATVFYTADIVYSIITISAPITDHALSFTFTVLAICVIIGWFQIIANILYTRKTGPEMHKRCDVYLAFISFCLAISLPFYLLTDNEQPLSLEFRCQPGTANATDQQGGSPHAPVECNNWTDHTLRLGFQVMSAAALLLTSGMLLCRYCKEKHYYYKYDKVSDADKIS